MNDIMDILAQRAGFRYIPSEGIGWAGNYNSSLELFAELIVRECAEVCLEANDHDNILKHFGLEK